jgi:hypothetical protein
MTQKTIHTILAFSLAVFLVILSGSAWVAGTAGTVVLGGDIVTKAPRYPNMITGDVVRSKILSGEEFSVDGYDEDVDTGTPKQWRITTCDDRSCRINFDFSASNAGLLEMYEAPTINVSGTLMTPGNKNRNIAATGETTWHEDCTTSAAGDLLCAKVIGSNSPTARIGGTTEGNFEIILKKSTEYVIKFTPLNDNTRASLCGEWSEPGI